MDSSVQRLDGQPDATLPGQPVAPVKTGKFTAEESAIVCRTVLDVCAARQIDVAQLCTDGDHKPEFRGVWQEVALCLPHRTVQSVYRHGMRKFHSYKRGLWSDEDIQRLVNFVALHGKKWSAVAAKLNRSPDSCRDKYRETNDDYAKGRWKDNETELLKRLIREHVKVCPTTDATELAVRIQKEGIVLPWGAISKRMGKRSRLSCLKKWQNITSGITATPCKRKQPPSKPPSNYMERIKRGRNVTDIARGLQKPERKPKTESVTHRAPTAGAATAAALAAALNKPMRATAVSPEHKSDKFSNTSPTNTSNTEYDTYLLSELANAGVAHARDVDWASLRLDNALDRWAELAHEWQISNADNPATASLPLSEMAQAMLDRKASAQRAAATVEAIDLPNPASLPTAIE